MKKFLSMVLAAAMVISTVPATAFALDAKATAKVVDSRNLTEADADKVEEGANPTNWIGQTTTAPKIKAPELQLKVTDADSTANDNADTETKFTVTLDNAKFVTNAGAVVTSTTNLTDIVSVVDDEAKDYPPTVDGED